MQNKHTLLLNSNYEVIRIITWQRAIQLSFLNKVETIDVYQDSKVHSKFLTLDVPAVVRLKVYIKQNPKNMRYAKKYVMMRDNFQCLYCGRDLQRNSLTVDHVIPRCRGGETSWENCVACCKDCNELKKNLSLREAGMSLLKKPIKPSPMGMFDLAVKLNDITIPSNWKPFIRK